MKKYLPAIAAVMFLTLLLMSPAEWFPVWLDEMMDQIPYSDKMAHLALFMSLSIYLLVLFPNKKRRIILSLCLYSLATEYFQPLTGRSESSGDLIADLIGLVVCCLALKWYNTTRNQPEDHQLAK